MKLTILTTETTHHCRFVQGLQEDGHEVFCAVETTNRHPPHFDISSETEQERDIFESDHWFNSRPMALSQLSETVQLSDINDILHSKAVSILEDSDAIIVFGTGVIRKPVLDQFGRKLVNLHGGDPEKYRGLDSHLWALYHRDFSSLVTTLHKVELELDTGGIVEQGALNLDLIRDPSQLRSLNTDCCLTLTRDYLSKLAADSVTLRPQAITGRYYSYMPSVLKQIAYGNLKRYLLRGLK